MNSISVVIVTKNRAVELSQCLGSLLSNAILPDEILVVDNNSTDQTKQLILGLQKQTIVPVRLISFFGDGYPTIYNKGLREASGDWVAFIDDDCVADENWVQELKNTIKSKSGAAVVMGWCQTYYPENVYSQATLLFDNHWKERAIKGEEVTDFEVLDNKNIAYKKSFLQEHELRYDESRVKYSFGAAEDCDLGIQIQEAGGVAYCNKKMLIWHKDPQDWLWFMKKTLSSWHAYRSLSAKWDFSQRKSLQTPAQPIEVLLKEVTKNLNYSFFDKVKLVFITKQVLLLNRVLPLLFRNQKYEK